MSDYIISCCSTADLTEEHFNKRDIHYICFHYELDGAAYMDDLGKTINLDDFYEFYEDTYELAGSATNKRYKLGQKIKVVVDSTDKIMRTIDFKPAE